MVGAPALKSQGVMIHSDTLDSADILAVTASAWQSQNYQRNAVMVAETALRGLVNQPGQRNSQNLSDAGERDCWPAKLTGK